MSRNPVSIYASLKTYDKKLPEHDSEKNFWFNNVRRFKRWLENIDPSMTSELIEKEPLEQFVMFYNRRMGQLYDTGLPIVRYEDLVTDARETVSKVCSILGISLEEKMLQSHQKYDEGMIGHGENDLSKPIDTSLLTKYKETVTLEEFEYIRKHTLDVYQKYGYRIENNEISVF